MTYLIACLWLCPEGDLTTLAEVLLRAGRF